MSLTSRHRLEVVTTNDCGTVSHQFGQPVPVLVNSQPVGGKRVTKTVGNPPNLKTPLVTLETSGKPHLDRLWQMLSIGFELTATRPDAVGVARSRKKPRIELT